MPSVQIDEIGEIEFPDGMSEGDIQSAIEKEILPTHRQQRFDASPSMRPSFGGAPSPATSEGVKSQESVSESPTDSGFIEMRDSLKGSPFSPKLGPLPQFTPEAIKAKGDLYNQIKSERQQALDLAGDNPDKRSEIDQVFRSRAKDLGVNLVEDVSLEDLGTGGVPLTKMIPTPPESAGKLEKAATGVLTSVAGAGEFLTSPKGAAAMLNPAIGAGVLLEMAGQVPEIGKRLGESIAKGDWKEAAQAGADAIMAVGIGKHVGGEVLNSKQYKAAKKLGEELQREIQSPEWQARLADANRIAVNRMAPGTMRPQEIRGMPGSQITAPEGAVVNSRANIPPDPFKDQRTIEIPRRAVIPPVREVVIDQPSPVVPVTRGPVKTNVQGGRESFSADSPRLNREAVPVPERPVAPEPKVEAVEPPPPIDPQPDWRVTVQNKQGEVPGYVSIADPRATEQSGKIVLPEGAPDFSKLPTGRYTWAEAVAKLDELSKKEAPSPKLSSPDEIAKEYPDLKIQPGDVAVMVEQADGKVVPAKITGYMAGRPWVAKIVEGKPSHGLLAKGDKIVSEHPNEAVYNSDFKPAKDAHIAAIKSAREKEFPENPTPPRPRPVRTGEANPNAAIPDALHIVQSWFRTNKLSLASARRIDQNFKPEGSVKDVFTAEGGYGIDVARQALEDAGIRFADDGAFLEYLKAAPEMRRGDREAKATEAELMGKEEAAYRRLTEPSKVEPESRDGTPVEAVELKVGDEWKRDGETVRVTDIDADGNITLRGGATLGEVPVRSGAKVFPDKDTFKASKEGGWEPDSVIDTLESWKVKREGDQSFSLPHPEAIKAIGEAVWNTALDVAIAGIKAGKTVGRAVADALAHIRKNSKGQFDETQIRNNLASALQENPKKSTTPNATPAPDKETAKPSVETVKKDSSESDPLADVYDRFIPEPKKTPTVKEVAKAVSESVRTGLSSKFRPLDRLVEDINKVYGAGQKKIAGIFEALKGSSGRSEAEVFRFDRDVSDLVKGHEKDFNAYMFLRRSLDRLKQDEAQGTERRSVSGYSIPELEGKLATLEGRLGSETLGQFQKAADNYQSHMNKALQWQVESGRMSPEVYEKIKSENQFYAPFKVLKYLEESGRPAGTGARVDTPAEYTKAMVGIEDPNFKLGDMLAAARMNLRVSRILSDKHAAMQKVSDLAAFDVEGRFIRKLEGDAKPGRGMESVNVFQNGEKVRYEVPKDVAESLQLFTGPANDLVSAVLSGAAVPFRAGATAWNIPFQASNILADLPRAGLVSRFGIDRVSDLYRFPVDYIQSLHSSIMGDVAGKPNQLFLDFLDSGAAGTTIQESLSPKALRFQQTTGMTGAKNAAKNTLMTLPHFAAAIEQATKILGVKRAMRREGHGSGADLYRDAKDAVTEVRRFSGSPDFGRIGKQMEALRLNLLVMFLNARVQGTVADIGRLAGRDGPKAAAATWAKLGTAVGVPSAILYAANHASQELSDDYAKVPDRERQNYWHIPKDAHITLESGERIRDYWRIPKRESAKWIANLVESSLDFAKDKSPEQAGRWIQSLVEDVAPINIQGNTMQEKGESALSSLNPVIKAPIETFTGRDMFRHRPLVPDNMKNASPENQFTDRTPAVFKALANAMPDVAPEAFRSPIMLENMTQNLTAGMISQFLPKRPIEGRSAIENSPLLQRFQAAPYTDQRAFRENIQTLKRQAVDASLARMRTVDRIVRDSKGEPLPNLVRKAIKEAGPDRLVIERVVDAWVAKQNGITPQERQVMALPSKERAEYLESQMKSMTAEQKREAIQNWAKKRILTEAVAVEMAK